MRTKRQGMIVWFQHRKNIKTIKRYGHLLYVSKKMRYAVLYVNQDQYENIINDLLERPFVTKIDRSHRPFLKTDYENALRIKQNNMIIKLVFKHFCTIFAEVFFLEENVLKNC